MKKILCLSLATVLILILFTGCGGFWSYFGSSVKTYSTDDLSIELPGNMMDLKGKELSEYEMVRANDKAGVMLRKENRESLDVIHYPDAQSYAELLQDSLKRDREIESELKQSAAGNPVLCYTFTDGGNSYCYYTVVLSNEEAFFSLELYCSADRYEELLPQFEAWEATIVMK